ncbi:hypothetical protein [Pelosinus sp. sgz500959]|uniref:hypothetical protein n=1 Tax=Pelosinus sp. sgz500959 TaxID=3242472 RepID=UPI00366B2E1A
MVRKMIKYTFKFRDSSLVVELNCNIKIAVGDVVNIVVNSKDQLLKVDMTSYDNKRYDQCVVAEYYWQTKVVELRQRVVYEPHVNLVYKPIKEYVSKDFVENTLRKVALEFKMRALYIEGDYCKSNMGRIVAVAERLELVARMNKKEVAMNLGFQQEALCIYLLLTCFDLLGQPDDWLTFESWLSSSNKEHERMEALRKIKSSDIIEGSKLLYLEYQKIYGVKNAFFRFIREVLSDDMRYELLDSIRIVITSRGNESSKSIKTLGTLREKEEYLFAIRNNYTHKASFLEGNTGKIPPGIEHDAFRQREFININQTKRRLIYCQFWPNIIESIVQRGLVRYLQDIDSKVQKTEWLPSIVKPDRYLRFGESWGAAYSSANLINEVYPSVRV